MADALRFHPLADLFPLMEGTEFANLVADIRLRQAIVLHEGMILDGRNRDRACREVGLPIHPVLYDGDDPLAFVISQNLYRRHLNESQRAMIAAKLGNMPAHRPASKSAMWANAQCVMRAPCVSKGSLSWFAGSNGEMLPFRWQRR
jgi:hypothetical protein